MDISARASTRASATGTPPVAQLWCKWSQMLQPDRQKRKREQDKIFLPLQLTRLLKN